MENLQEQELIFGQMGKGTMDNGSMDSNMDRACGEVTKEIVIKESGNLENLKVMEYTLFQMETLMKVSSRNALNMERE